MNLILEAYGDVVEVRNNNEDMEVIEILRSLVVPALLSAGFSLESIHEGIEEYTEAEGICDACRDGCDCDTNFASDDTVCVCGKEGCFCSEKGYGYYKVGRPE